MIFLEIQKEGTNIRDPLSILYREVKMSEQTQVPASFKYSGRRESVKRLKAGNGDENDLLAALEICDEVITEGIEDSIIGFFEQFSGEFEEVFTWCLAGKQGEKRDVSRDLASFAEAMIEQVREHLVDELRAKLERSELLEDEDDDLLVDSSKIEEDVIVLIKRSQGRMPLLSPAARQRLNESINGLPKPIQKIVSDKFKNDGLI